MVIDKDGYRANVGIIVANHQGQVFLGKRIKQDAWQFPQGGLNANETAEECLFRELREEIGLQAQNVKIIAATNHWLRYKIPKKFLRSKGPRCIGQKQKWFLLELLGEDSDFNFNFSHKPEFDDWEWVSYWFPLTKVVKFKCEVYRKALQELRPKFIQLNAPNLPLTPNYLDSILNK